MAANAVEPTPSPAPTRSMLPISEIRTDGGTQPREELDPDTVDRYAEAMEAGADFPPVRVFHDGKHHWLSDGFHRLFAKKQTSGTELDAEIFQGTLRDAILDSVGANSRHGLPRSNEDKRLAVQILLNDPVWSQWSDSVIAQKANVSQPFVSKLRRTLPLLDPAPTQNVLSGKDDDQVSVAPATVRRGADNRTINTSKIGRKETVTPAKTDLTLFPSSNEGTKSALQTSTAAEPDGWNEAGLVINISVEPGKADRRKVHISGRAGEGSQPIFRSGFTAADLYPMPAALEALLGDLKKAYSKAPKPAAAKTPAKSSKPTPKAKPSKKKPTKPAPKTATKKTARKK